MKILAIDSSSLVMGVSVATEKKILGELVTNSLRNHSERLMPAIDQLMRETGTSIGEMDRIAVACGPGSYTGLRIGVTIAKTLAWTLRKELVGVSSLEIMAQNGRYFPGYIAPFSDARRGQVYAGLYRYANGSIHRAAEDRLLLMENWFPELEALNQPILFISNDLDKWKEKLSGRAWANLGNPAQCYPRPGELARIGIEKEPVQDIHHFLPAYLRLAEAETKWLAGQGQ